MVEKWKAQEIVQYLEEQLSNSLLHDDLFEAIRNVICNHWLTE